MEHKKYMQMALKLAKKGRGFTSPNPIVGALLVKKDKIIGEGYHKKFGHNHAEVEAINRASDSVSGSTLYVTMEPCNHTGKTPPCTKRIIDAGIKHVVFATKDPNTNVKGNGEQSLKQHDIRVTSGICEKEALILNEYFIKHAKTGLPFVIVKCAATLDGQIATRTGNSKWITGSKARRYVHEMRHGVDGIMVGKNTILNDDPSLTTRLDEKRGTDSSRIILDTNLSIPLAAKVINQKSEASTYVITGNNVDITKRKIFEESGVRVIPLAGKNGKIDIVELVKLLGKMGVTSLLVEGGGKVINSMLSSGLVDKVCLFYAPKILTGNDGVPICSGPGPNMIEDAIDVHGLSVNRFGKDIMVQGYIKK